MSPRLQGRLERYQDDMRFNFHVPTGQEWLSVVGRHATDLTRVVLDAIVSTTDVSVEIRRQSADGYVGQTIQGPWCTVEGRYADAIASGFRAIYQAGVDASGVAERQNEAIANWVRDLGKHGQLGWTEKDEAQLLALADGIFEGRASPERDKLLQKVILNAMPTAMLRPFVVPVRSSFEVVVRDERQPRDGRPPRDGLEPITGTLFLRCLATRDVA